MKMLSQSRCHYVARFSFFLITLALMTGIAGCSGSVIEYDLAIASTTGGLVATPGVGTFAYATGTVVNLEAKPEAGYHFVAWTGDVSTVADVNDTTTTITMDSDYSIIASFAFGSQCIPMVAAGGYHTIGLKDGGTVVAAGYDSAGQCNVGGWTNIIQVATGYGHTVGLRANGSQCRRLDRYHPGRCRRLSYSRTYVRRHSGCRRRERLRAVPCRRLDGDHSGRRRRASHGGA